MNLTDHYNSNQIVTPAYCYNLKKLRNNLSNAQLAAKKFGYHIHYAFKANNNQKIVDEIKQFGFGADCVSGGEINLAISSHFSADSIFFAGVGKTDDEIDLALNLEILAFNVESIHELKVIGTRAKEIEKTARIALRINPNIDAQTHEYITTGLEENKFGIFSHEILTCLSIIKKNPFLNFVGLHFHVGSQITDLAVFKKLCLKVNEWNRWFSAHDFTPQILNLGGGLGINYESLDEPSIVNFDEFFTLFNRNLKLLPNQKVHFELGRSLVASCGNLLTKVLYLKSGLHKNFVIVDAGMTELLRSALYQSFHPIKVIGNNFKEKNIYDIVGPICESSDYFGKDVLLPKLSRGDLLAILHTGAYGEVMSSRYNLRKPYACYFID